MSEIIFTELRQFNSTITQIRAIIKYNGLIFFSTNKTAGGEIWTFNPLTRAFLLNSTFPAGDGVRDFIIGSAASVEPGKLLAVTGGVDGKLYSYNNDGTWTEEADTTDSGANAIAEFQTLFYIGTNGDQVYRWDGASLTTSLTAAETSGDITALAVHDGLLFAGSIKAADAEIFVFDNSSWALEDNLTAAGVNQVNAFQVFNGGLYASTPKSGGSFDLWLRDDDISPNSWAGVTSTTENGIEAMAVFMDKLYFGTITDDSIQRYDGTNFVTVKEAVTGISSYFSAFADGEDCLYFGSAADTTTVGLFAICPRCSDELLISEASPFGWNVGDCDITPEICLIEDGCFCQIINTDDGTVIQIQFNGAGTPHLAISDITTGEESSITAFTNVVGIIWEVTIDLTGLNCENIQFIVTTRTQVDQGEWIDNSIGGIIDIEDVHVSSLDFVFICGSSANALLKLSTDSAVSFSDKTAPATGAQGVAALSMRAGPEETIHAARTNGFGYSIDALDSYVNDTNHTRGGPVVMRSLNVTTILIVNKSGGAATLSNDNGATWVSTGNAASNGVTDCEISTSLIFFVTQGAAKTIEKTTDGAATAWNTVHTDSVNLNGIKMTSSTAGIVVGDSGRILRTTDGSTFVVIASPTAQNLNKVYFANSSIGWAVGDNGTVIKTIDSGLTWVLQTFPSSVNLNNVHAFITGSQIFVVAVGDNGGVFSLGDTTGTGLDFATSECIKIKNDSQCGLLIKYTNDDNFADFDYTNGLVNQIRIEAHFWKIENPQEKSIHITSAEEVIPLRQVVKRQVMLETGIMPEYMHEKLSIIFSHAAIEIEGITYVAEGDYEHDPFANNFRQAKGHVLLTDKTYTKENIF